ncbi:MAG: dUTP diphosphatase [Candidatus Cloacimonetes bacterium]|nr:dUTP diphosphatase [Candidatus Cloacimonadota bacterium]
MIRIGIKRLVSQAIIPQKMSQNAAGYDLYSANETTQIIKPRDIALIPTGIAISIPHGYEAQIRPRSGLSLNYGIGILNSPGTIDADYRGEIKVILFNASEATFYLEPGTRIAQMVISQCHEIEFDLCTELDETTRGSGGFGHTDLK